MKYYLQKMAYLPRSKTSSDSRTNFHYFFACKGGTKLESRQVWIRNYNLKTRRSDSETRYLRFERLGIKY